MADMEIGIFDGYEKGVIARALLETMIKRGFYEDRTDGDEARFEIVLPIEHWQMSLLACFIGDEKSAEMDFEAIREVLSHTR